MNSLKVDFKTKVLEWKRKFNKLIDKVNELKLGGLNVNDLPTLSASQPQEELSNVFGKAFLYEYDSRIYYPMNFISDEMECYYVSIFGADDGFGGMDIKIIDIINNGEEFVLDEYFYNFEDLLTALYDAGVAKKFDVDLIDFTEEDFVSQITPTTNELPNDDITISSPSEYIDLLRRLKYHINRGYVIHRNTLLKLTNVYKDGNQWIVNFGEMNNQSGNLVFINLLSDEYTFEYYEV